MQEIFLVRQMTIPICVNRKLLRMKSTAKQENNRNFEKNRFLLLICSDPRPGGLQHQQRSIVEKESGQHYLNAHLWPNHPADQLSAVQ